jgi:sensor histidine kinase YesM
MQLRFGDRIVVEWAVADAARGARVPFLVLQPLVENAYEHGLAGRETGGRVRIGAARAGDTLRLVVEDDGSGLDVQAGSIVVRENARTGGGIGLRNTRERLAQSYGARASLALERPPGGGTRAVVTLPFVDGPRGSGGPRP